MSWLAVPTIARRLSGILSGYYVGRDEDADFYCFDNGTPQEPAWRIGESLDPVLVFDGVPMRPEAYLYGGHTVWSGLGAQRNQHVFYASSLGYWVFMQDVREPILYPLLEGEDETDRIGDVWYRISIDMDVVQPGVSGYAARMGACANLDDGKDTVPFSYEHDLYEQVVNDADNAGGRRPFGLYVRARDGAKRYVGAFDFKQVNIGFSWQNPPDYIDEQYTCTGESTWTGSLGHNISKGDGYWLIGSGSDRRWFQSDDDPPMEYDADWLFYEYVRAENGADASQTGVRLRLKRNGAAASAGRPTKILIGEAELWR